MKIYTFSQFKLAIEPASNEIWEKVKRDFTHMPQDAVEMIEEWKGMYDKYSGGGINQTVRNTFKDAALEVLTDIWLFLHANFYWVALFGGLGVILLYVCGHRGALKWLWTLVVAYVLICAIGTAL